MQNSPIINSLIKFISNKHIHLLLLPVYFFLSSYIQFAGLFNITVFIWPAIKVIIAVAVCFFISLYIFKTSSKSALFTSFFSLVYLYFGNIRESLGDIPFISHISHYRFIIPLTFAAILFVAYRLKKLEKTDNLTAFLNLLLILYTSVEIIRWKNPSKVNFELTLDQPVLSSATKANEFPDIFYIVLDGYPSGTFQKERIDIKVNQFDSSLKEKEFYIVSNPRSNYNYTAFSTETVFRMDYIKGLKDESKPEPNDYSNAAFAIKNARIFSFLEEKGYQLYNLSIFDLPGKPSFSGEKFFFVTTSNIIFRNTLWNRIKWDILPAILTNYKNKLAASQHVDSWKNIRLIKEFNKKAYDSLWHISSLQNDNAKFVYTHLEMPHSPYLYDSSGKEYPDSLLYTGNIQIRKAMYKSYINYVNNKIKSIIEKILTGKNKNTVIIIQSDHGCRESEVTNNKKDAFRNYSAFYFPDKNYSLLYDSMSNVNTFRIILNKYFDQQLPLLKDSSIYLKF